MRTAVTGLALVLTACGAPPPLPSRAAPPAATAAPTVLRYTFMSLSRSSGSLVVTVAPDGARSSKLDILENGRGPTVTSKTRVASDGTLASFDAEGFDEMRKPVFDHFERDGATARWRTFTDRGERATTEPAFYLPTVDAPDIDAVLVAALQRAGGKLALLPDGEAKIERLTETTVTVRGESRHVTAHRVTGITLRPRDVWLDDDGTYFAHVEAEGGFVREGWESVADPLVAALGAVDRVRDAAQAKRLGHAPPSAGLAFTHARVFDAISKKWLPDHTVVIKGGVIDAVGPSRTTRAPAGAEVVDATGKSLLPGLWDMHAHLAADQPLDYVASGVTTVRDLANDPEVLDDWKRRFDDGTAIGPRVLRAGFIEGRGPQAAGSKITAETDDEARAAVEFYAKRGWEQIKIYNSIKPELVPLLAREAHARGMRVSGHVPAFMRAEDAVRQGYDEIQHVNMLFLNFLVDAKTDTRSPLRFTLVAEKAATLDLGSDRVKTFIALLKAHGTVVDPTLGVFEELFVGRTGELTPAARPMADRLPPATRRAFLRGGLAVPEGKDALYKSSFEATKKLVAALHASGIPVVAGTDEPVPGHMLHRELEIYVDAGIPAADALYLATFGSARVMKLDTRLGAVAKGFDADVVLVDGDPIARIADVRRVVTVVRGGTLYASETLLGAAGFRSAP